MAHSLMRSTAVVSAMTLLSRGFGFVRDLLMARAFGAGPAMDAFFVAFKIPNFLRRLFAEGSFSQAFIPVLAERRAQGDLAEVRAFADRVAGTLGGILLIVTVLGVILAPVLIFLFAPGFDGANGQRELAISLLRITFPYLLFISLTAFASGLLNTYGQFAVPAFTPVLLNLSFIGMALFAAPHFNPPVLALAWAVFLGGVLQLALQLPFLAKIGMLPRFSLSLADEGVRRILLLMLPALLGVSVSQISLLINTIFASFLPTGSVSWLYYADRLMEFPAGLLGAALGTILLPSLSKSHAENDRGEFSALLDWGLRLTFLLTLPAALGLALLAVPLLATLFNHGAFQAEDVLKTREALVAYSVGLTGLILVKVLAPGFYARQNIRTPVKIALVTLAATQAMNAAFIVPLQHAGLALSIGLASCLNAALLWRGLRRNGDYAPQPGWWGFLARLAVALAALGLVLWFGMGAQSDWIGAPALARILRLAALVTAGGGAYFGTLWLLGFRLKDFGKKGRT